MERAAGLLFVLALHAAILWGLWQHRLIPAPTEAATLFVNLLAPPAPAPLVAPKPKPRQIVAAAPSVAPTDYVAPPPPPMPEPAPVIEALPMPLPAGPVALGGDLSAACPERTPPRYPPISRRLGEEGTVVLHVELDERGHISAARVSTSSGFARLDAAALAAVHTWRCQPASAVARQPFKFVLQGN